MQLLIPLALAAGGFLMWETRFKPGQDAPRSLGPIPVRYTQFKRGMALRVTARMPGEFLPDGPRSQLRTEALDNLNKRLRKGGAMVQSAMVVSPVNDLVEFVAISRTGEGMWYDPFGPHMAGMTTVSMERIA